MVRSYSIVEGRWNFRVEVLLLIEDDKRNLLGSFGLGIGQVCKCRVFRVVFSDDTVFSTVVETIDMALSFLLVGIRSKSRFPAPARVVRKKQKRLAISGLDSGILGLMKGQFHMHQI